MTTEEMLDKMRAAAIEKKGGCIHSFMSPWSYEKIVVEDHEVLLVGYPVQTMAFPRKTETIVTVRHCESCGRIERGAQS